MFEFERLNSGNVVLKENGNVIRIFPSSTYISADQFRSDVIILNNSNGNANDPDAYTIKVDTVITPSNTDRDDLMYKLALSYFRPVDNDSSGLIAQKTVTTNQVNNNTSEFLVSLQNINRSELVIHNDSNAVVLIKYGSDVSSVDYTYKLFKQDSLLIDDFNGDIYAIADSNTGFLMVTQTTIN